MSSSVLDMPIPSMMSSTEMPGGLFHVEQPLMHQPASAKYDYTIPMHHTRNAQNDGLMTPVYVGFQNDKISGSSSKWATAPRYKGNRENIAYQRHLTKLFTVSLKRMGILLVAIDFDRTIVATHTRGAWKETPDDIAKLAAFVRPSFIDLITTLIENGILVAVVSFSPQTSVIRSTLERVLDPDVASNMFIQCSTSSLMANNSAIGGKENHLVAIVSYINQVTGRLINSREILLIDDDSENVMTALTFGHYAIHYDDDTDEISWLDRNIACSTG